MAKDGRIWLSHSGISVLNRCPRCFWLQYRKKIRQPEGIKSRLANRFDEILKSYFNIFRERNILPPMVSAELEGKLESPFQEKYFVRINEKYGFWGKLDECLVNTDKKHIPVDFKTASSDPRSREILDVYKDQINAYLFLISQSNKKTGNCGYLMYVYPKDGEKLHEGFPMVIYLKKIEGDPKKAKKKIEKAIEVLEKEMPKPSPTCDFCTWFKTITIELGTKNSSSDYGQLTFA